MSIVLRQINAVGWRRILLVFLLIWLAILLFTAFPMLGTHLNSADSKLYERLNRALKDLEALRQQNVELQDIFKDINLEYVLSIKFTITFNREQFFSAI